MEAGQRAHLLKRVAILGAGVSGLACAHRLWEIQKQRRGGVTPPLPPFEILLFEASDKPGGNIQTEFRDGFLLERGPDSFISDKPWALDLCRRLNLESELINTESENRRVFICRGGVTPPLLTPVPEGFYMIAPTKIWSFLATPLFSLPAKFRMAMELWTPKGSPDLDESVGSFIRRRFGREALERVGQPMIAGVYSGDPERLSMRSTMPHFIEMENSHGSVIRALRAASKKQAAIRSASGPRYSLFLSFKKGMATLVSALEKKLPEGTLKICSRAESLEYDAELSKWRIYFTDGKVEIVDALCSTLPASATSRLLKASAPAFSKKLDQMRYESVATVNLAYSDEALQNLPKGFGFVVPASERRSLMACSFSSQKFKSRAPRGHQLLRAFAGGAFGKEFFEKSDEDLKNAVSTDLKNILGIRQEPLFYSVSRHPSGMPQYSVGHSRWIQSIEEVLADKKGLFLTGSSYRGSGIADCVHEAEIQAQKLERFLTVDIGR